MIKKAIEKQDLTLSSRLTITYCDCQYCILLVYAMVTFIISYFPIHYCVDEDVIAVIHSSIFVWITCRTAERSRCCKIHILTWRLHVPILKTLLSVNHKATVMPLFSERPTIGHTDHLLPYIRPNLWWKFKMYSTIYRGNISQAPLPKTNIVCYRHVLLCCRTRL